MLGSRQAIIIGILRTEYEKDPERFLTTKEILNLLNNRNEEDKSLSYNTIATILKRLADQGKINSLEDRNKYLFKYKDIENQISEKILQTFINAFGTSGLAHLIEKGKKLNESDIEDLKEFIDKT